MRVLAALIASLVLPAAAVQWWNVASAGNSLVVTGPIRVTLTAQNHQPRPTENPGWHWRYCVKVRTAAGKPVAATIHLQILLGRTAVERVGIVSLKKGNWCAAIGGEGNVLDAAPRGKKLVFQAVVTAKGVTVKRNWPIVVR